MRKLFFISILLSSNLLFANEYTPPSYEWKLQTMKRYDSTDGKLIAKKFNFNALFYTVFQRQVTQEIKSKYSFNNHIAKKVSFDFFKYYTLHGFLPNRTEYDSNWRMVKDVVLSIKDQKFSINFNEFELAIERFEIEEGEPNQILR